MHGVAGPVPSLISLQYSDCSVVEDMVNLWLYDL